MLGEPSLDTRREVANYRSKKIEKSVFAVSTSGSTVSSEEPVPPVGASGGSSLLSSAVKGEVPLSRMQFSRRMNQGMVQGAPVKVGGVGLG